MHGQSMFSLHTFTIRPHTCGHVYMQTLACLLCTHACDMHDIHSALNLLVICTVHIMHINRFLNQEALREAYM